MKPLKVLLLEDNTNDALLIKKEIVDNFESNIDFKVVASKSDFEQGLLLFQPEIILSDYKLPQFNGLEALEIAKASMPEIPFIIVTGKMTEEAAADSIKAGAWDYVVKERLTRLPDAMSNSLKLKELNKTNLDFKNELAILSESIGLQANLLFTIIKNAPSSVVITDSDGKIEYVNPKFELVTGYSRSEAIGKNPRVLKSGFHNDEFYKEMWETLISGKTWTGELINKNKYGEIYYEYASISPISEGNDKAVKYLAIKNDITNLKRDEIKLLEQESLYKTIFDNKATANCLFSKDLKVISANERFFEIVEYDLNEINSIGKFSSFLSVDGRQLIKDFVAQRLVGKRSDFLLNKFEITTKSGEPKTVMASINKIDNMEVFMVIMNDISVEEKLQDRLLSSEQKFRLITESAQDAIIMIGVEGEITHWNPAASLIFGYQPYEVLGKNMHKLLAPEKYFSLYSKKFEEFRISGKGSSFNKIKELEAITKDGRNITIEISLSPLQLNNGYGAVGIIRDITERIESQKNLVIMAKAFQNIKECVSITDVDNKIIYVNKAFELTYGYSPDEIIGMDISHLLRNFNKDEIVLDSILVETLKGDWHGEILNYHKNGNEIPVYLSTTCVKNDAGEIIALVGVATDITEKNHTIRELEKAKRAAEESEERLFTYINTIPDSVCFKDGEGRWLIANSADLKLFQLENVDYYGKTDLELSNFTDEIYRISFEECMKSDEMAWQKGTMSTCVEIVPTTQGENKIFDVIKIPIFHKNGDRKGLAVIGRDITEMQKIADNLKVAKEKAEESDTLKTIFLANMSHEIRTPMNAILGYSSILSDYEISLADQKEYLSIIQRSGKQLLNLIDDIIDISKIETRQLKLSIAKTRLKDVVKNVYDNFVSARLIYNRPETSLKVSSAIELEDRYIFTDGGRLMQILTNLVNNALKYSKTGDIDLIYSLVENNGLEYIEFRVKDYGVGIPSEKQEVIFERFRQVEESNYRQGAGLGLSICKGLLDLLGGDISVTSELGQGSEFIFTIPYKPEVSVDKKNEVKIKSIISLSGTTIVFGEDDPDSITYLKILLSSSGAKYYHADNGQSFIDLFIEHNPDLSLLDINLPIKSGLECVKELRAKGFTNKIIAQTAYAMKEEMDVFMKAGFNDYISKPYSKHQLLNVINRNVEKM